MENTPMLRDGALKDKVIVVTGGGTGLGRSMTTQFLQLGAKVAITSRKLDVLEKTAQELRDETGGEVLAIACDVRKHQEVEAMFDQVEEKFGLPNVLVNNAAGNFISPTQALSPKAFETIIGIVLQGTCNCSLILGKRLLKARQKATMLNIVTTYAWTGSGFVVPSACAKAGVLSLTRSLASEWGKFGIRQVAIAPGPFPTKGAWDRLFPENIREEIDPLKRVPLGRVGEHHELANLASYLVSDFAAYINGEVITIDGGEWLKGAGEFNFLDQVTGQQWQEIEQLVRQANKGGKQS